MIYIKRYDYNNVLRGERKSAETRNGRELLNFASAAVLGAEPESTVLPEIAVTKHGKPFFKDDSYKRLKFNISHSGDYIAVIIACGEAEVGVDIQTVRPVRGRVIEKMCSGQERQFVLNSDDRDRAFIQLWTLKESYVKAIGTGMSFPMNTVNFDLTALHGECGKISNREGVFFTRDCGEYILSACALVNNACGCNEKYFTVLNVES